MRTRGIIWLMSFLLMIARGPSLAQTVADTSKKAGTSPATILQNPQVRDLISETEKRCHGCAVTAIEGDLAGSENRTVVMFVQDSGVGVRIARIKLENGIDVVFVVIPGGKVDLRLTKFMKKFLKGQR